MYIMARVQQASFLLLIVLLSFSVHAAALRTHSGGATPTNHPPATGVPTQSGNSTQFIETSCSATLYPKLCISSLSAFTASLHPGDSIQLALLAANVSLSHIRFIRARLGGFARQAPSSLSPRTLAALKTCAETISDAEDLTSQAGAELAKLQPPGAAASMGPGVAMCVDNARTWMSAALTDEHTCTDGLSEPRSLSKVSAVASPSAGAVREVMASVSRLKEYTSNALALVNCLINSHGR